VTDLIGWDDAVLLLSVAAVILALSAVRVWHTRRRRHRDRLR